MKPKTLLMEEPRVEAVTERGRVFRRKPLLVEVRQLQKPEKVGGAAGEAGDYRVKEAGSEILVRAEAFNGLYELVDADPESAVDIGLADLEPGTQIDREGKRMVRVVVVSGRGSVAYWAKASPRGAMVEFRVIADMNDNVAASHRAGKFVEPFEGKPGTRTWVLL